MRTYYLILDLKEEPDLINSYEQHHREVWPEVKNSIREAGILDMEIYKFRNRLMMKMDVVDGFDFSKKAELDAANSVVQKWEALMLQFQRPFEDVLPGEKWMPMKCIFKL
jgi:L-rhamnose mutarotase